MYSGKFFECFGELKDTRQEGKVLHKLIDIVFLTVTAVMCGINEWDQISVWATKEQTMEWLRKYIELRNGVPSESTLKRVFGIIDPKQFGVCFADWMHTLVRLSERDIVSVDGKTMRGSQEKMLGKKGVHIVSALCQSQNLVIGEMPAEEKSNEITAIPELFDLLFLEGCIVTIDAMGTQTKIVKDIKDKGADYVLSLKGNQGTVHQEVEEYFVDLEKDEALPEVEKETEKEGVSVLRTVDQGHGRFEKRTYYYSTDISWMADARKDWEDLTGIGMVDREVEKNGKISMERNYYLGSVESIDEFAASVRQHWGVESMHWSLDITFRDDANTTTIRNAAENMAILKRVALNVLRKDKQRHDNKSIRNKRFEAMLDWEYRDYLLDLSFGAQ